MRKIKLKIKSIKCFFVGHKNKDNRRKGFSKVPASERECTCCESRQFKYASTSKWLSIA